MIGEICDRIDLLASGKGFQSIFFMREGPGLPRAPGNPGGPGKMETGLRIPGYGRDPRCAQSHSQS